MLINLTPHTINIQTPREHITLEPDSRGPARLESLPRPCDYLEGCPCPVCQPAVITGISGLPDPIEGVFYITSAIVAEYAKRQDVLSPGTGPNDGAIRDNGRIVAVTQLNMALLD